MKKYCKKLIWILILFTYSIYQSTVRIPVHCEIKKYKKEQVYTTLADLYPETTAPFQLNTNKMPGDEVIMDFQTWKHACGELQKPISSINCSDRSKFNFTRIFYDNKIWTGNESAEDTRIDILNRLVLPPEKPYAKIR